MKKFALTLAITLTMLTWSAWLNTVSAECAHISISCSNGNGTTLFTCGSSAEMAKDVRDVLEALCGN